MGERERIRERRRMPTSILARCQEIGNATGMRVLLCLSLALNGLLICLLAARQNDIVCIACQHEFCNHLLQEEFGERCRRDYAISVSGRSLTKHAHDVGANSSEGCSMTSIQICHMWQMRANANAAAATAISIRKTNVANKVSKLASSQVCSRMHEGLITLSAIKRTFVGEEMTNVVACSGTFDVLMEEKTRLMRKANYEDAWKRQMQSSMERAALRVRGQIHRGGLRDGRPPGAHRQSVPFAPECIGGRGVRGRGDCQCHCLGNGSCVCEAKRCRTHITTARSFQHFNLNLCSV